MTKYKYVFEPLDLGFTSLKPNMGSMRTGLEADKNDFKKTDTYYAELAKGGVDFIFTNGITPKKKVAKPIFLHE